MGNLSKAVVFVLLLAPGLGAQTKESLLIGPGDLLHVQVFDTPELEEHVRVTDAGELPLVLGGPVKVSALTPAEAGHAIEDALMRGHFLLTPRVQVTLDETATQKVSILGEVRLPGAYTIQTPRSILEVLTLAGGLTDLADRKVLIERHGTSEKVPYFVSNAPDAALDAAVKVNPGDTILVPRAGIVYVLGDVGRPGGYAMTNNEAQLSALELIARAGGTSHTAIPSHARLIRKSKGAYVDMALPLSDMQKGKRPDLPLQADDMIYVPFSYMRNFAVSGSGIAASAASAAVYRF
jgi:polysaccharide export outer membrane protein